MGSAQSCSMDWPSVEEAPSTWYPRGFVTYTQLGEFFELGLIGGSAYYFTKGLVVRPSIISGLGLGARFLSGIRGARANALRVGGGTAAALGLMTTVAHAVEYYHKGENPTYNYGIAFAVTGAAIGARRGPFVASCSAFGFAALGLLADYYRPNWEAWLDKTDLELEQAKLPQQQNQINK